MSSLGQSCRIRRAFTLTDLCVILACLMLLLTLTPVLRHSASERQNRALCAINLKQIAVAMVTYANQNNGNYPRTYFDNGPSTQGKARTADELHDYTGVSSTNSFAPDGPKPNDTTASIFLLMKVSMYPMQILVCPSSDAIPYDQDVCGRVSDRSNFPSRQYFSYSMANPFPTQNAMALNWRWNISSLSTGNPLFSDMNSGSPELVKLTPTSPASAMEAANSPNHDGQGQNVLYGDESVVWQTSPFCGPPHPDGTIDNIFTSTASPGAAAVGGWPQDNLDAVMLPLATTGLQPPVRSKGIPMWMFAAGGGAVIVAGIVVFMMLRKKPAVQPGAASEQGSPPPIPPPPV